MNTSDSFSVSIINSTRSIIGILASSKDLTVGKDNRLPWYSTTDMVFFRRATIGNVIIMGRKTYESVGSQPLPKRVNIVVSSTLKQSDVEEGVIVVSNIFSAIKAARSVDLSMFERNTRHEHIFIAGGIELYDATVNIWDELLYSVIDVNCGSHGYGHEFISNKLYGKFIDVSSIENELLYYNDGSISVSDIDLLREVNHYYKPNADNKFKIERS